MIFTTKGGGSLTTDKRSYIVNENGLWGFIVLRIRRR